MVDGKIHNTQTRPMAHGIGETDGERPTAGQLFLQGDLREMKENKTK